MGYTKTWNSRWFAKQGYAALLQEDLRLKATLRQKLRPAGISSIELDRPGNKLRVTIRTARPGIVIGRRGAPCPFWTRRIRRLFSTPNA